MHFFFLFPSCIPYASFFSLFDPYTTNRQSTVYDVPFQYILPQSSTPKFRNSLIPPLPLLFCLDRFVRTINHVTVICYNDFPYVNMFCPITVKTLQFSFNGPQLHIQSRPVPDFFPTFFFCNLNFSHVQCQRFRYPLKQIYGHQKCHPPYYTRYSTQ